ncbi:RES domain-containing protein [Cyclonatronum proteinivorum]|uniref:RES domain-containing protein n=1 Tax=Cyclonatronum proteinivorum TaxID=1457365 RepID=A0A345UL52_9BACT|nr:RES family NAD+ phosphorylase [Cyclonatronum proteinivorum]AXJ01204.1 RES domain-containing protein [Cyclonatronum proteinivorum]
MFVYRISLARWAGALSGSGRPGRWNSAGQYVVYTASSRALSCLEYLVHVGGERAFMRYKLTQIEIPDKCSRQIILPASLPENWHRVQNYHLCQPVGDRWADGLESLILMVPSAIISDEFNIIINPAHPQFSQVKISEIKDFTFDQRL